MPHLHIRGRPGQKQQGVKREVGAVMFVVPLAPRRTHAVPLAQATAWDTLLFCYFVGSRSKGGQGPGLIIMVTKHTPQHNCLTVASCMQVE